MGYYINPRDGESAEHWLADHGVPVPQPDILTMVPDDGIHALVCLIDNGPFKAAAIIHDAMELKEFSYPGGYDGRDWRPRRWYLVPRSQITGQHPEFAKELGW
jgi:hypothetical protein